MKQMIDVKMNVRLWVMLSLAGLCLRHRVDSRWRRGNQASP